MTQRDRDRLVVLKKAAQRLITRRQAAKEMDVSERQVRRMLRKLKKQGDQAVLHGLRGRRSNRRFSEERRGEVIGILAQEVYRGFGPTLASEYLAKKHGLEMGREAVRQLMMGAGLWRSRRQKVEAVHVWRERRSCRGELLQWDTSTHEWLEGRGERMYLIHMIDDASSELTARFVRSDSTAENMRLLWAYLEHNGRPGAFYTDKASLFRTAPKVPRDQKQLPRDERDPLPPTQIGRALQELGIVWIAAHSPQAKGRVERSFSTAQDRLVKGLRVAGGQDDGRGQPVSGTGVSAVVEPAFDSGAGQSHRRAPAAGTRTPFGSFSQPCGNATSGLRLHHSARCQDLSRCAPAARAAGRPCTSRSAAGRVAGGAASRTVSECDGMCAAAPGHRRGQSGCCAPGATALAPSSQTLGGIACGPQRIVAQVWIAALEGGRNQSHSYARRDGLSSGKRNKERRAKTARRIFAFIKPKASALKLHHPDMANSKSTSKSKTPEQQCSRALELPISNGASPIASALGIRLGATPRGRIHSNIHPPALPRKADISIWQKSGHFYLALTELFCEIAG